MRREGYEEDPSFEIDEGSKEMKRKKRSAKYKAWDNFSVFIRTREADENGMSRCISCGIVKHWKELQAGHYIPKSISLALKFDERNVNAQCAGCNMFGQNSIAAYAVNLRKKYGENILEELLELKRQGEGFRISEPEYRELAEKYKGYENED